MTIIAINDTTVFGNTIEGALANRRMIATRLAAVIEAQRHLRTAMHALEDAVQGDSGLLWSESDERYVRGETLKIIDVYEPDPKHEWAGHFASLMKRRQAERMEKLKKKLFSMNVEARATTRKGE
jgi:hypothetical protein